MQKSRKRAIAVARRHRRVRKKISGSPDRPRLVVYRSRKHIYAQIIDDVAGRTLCAASTLGSRSRDGSSPGTKSDQSKETGLVLARAALEKGIKHVVFDRGGYRYHGRVKVLAEAAREGGLEF
ncbi:50S ribosomal protein L18 [candidate division TA06 bacterium DG_24]|uniref:Large ribosomal subunit protein uL18 n=3 Tax=Bacteria division TA06 TaxID=1156500 RepID=A0A0S8JID6_UNCT6|nr:MAG: 50S ribosomal protein L18 [candidate division TA06 bacterium DG_24]KPK70899.1 MAG: 50S ribosomal protein L18 [candidate division TA06 bacterium SM23_40]KPL09574.1 MAG: 50S ribosomal protein L18 [candidate division TA06 bacterium SM1_40]